MSAVNFIRSHAPENLPIGNNVIARAVLELAERVETLEEKAKPDLESMIAATLQAIVFEVDNNPYWPEGVRGHLRDFAHELGVK